MFTWGRAGEFVSAPSASLRFRRRDPFGVTEPKKNLKVDGTIPFARHCRRKGGRQTRFTLRRNRFAEMQLQP